MAILSFKALHIIGFVSWFSGLFYFYRMLIYHVEANEQPEAAREVLHKQFVIMQNRVYKIIMNPAMIITWIGGLGMLFSNPAYLQQGWIHVKLTLVLGLTGYHHFSKRIMKNIQAGTNEASPQKLRMQSEVATLFLVAIVLLAVFGRVNMLNFLYAFIGVLLFGVLLFRGVKYYKKVREKNPNA